MIPTYNASSLLMETLDTVLAQTFTDFEVIIINDGSTDDTLSLLAGVNDSRIRIVTQDNQGIGAARNRGIDESCGDYIAFLDHDDLWKPEKLQAQVNFMRTHPACIAVMVPWSESPKPNRSVFDPLAVVRSDGIINRPNKLLAEGVHVIMTSGLLVDRKRIGGVRYAPQRGAMEDLPFQIKLTQLGDIGLAGTNILMINRKHGTNFSSQASFFYLGAIQLQRMYWEGEFPCKSAADDNEVAAYIAYVNRCSAVIQLSVGRRLLGINLYFAEFMRQLHFRRWKFLFTFPLFAILPQALIRRAFPHIDSR